MKAIAEKIKNKNATKEEINSFLKEFSRILLEIKNDLSTK